jgi:hypothetical protein
MMVMCLPLCASAQSDKLVDKYSQLEGCSTIELSKDMIHSMGAAKGIDTLTAISVDESSLIEGFYAETMEYVQGMSRIMSVVQSGQRVMIYTTMDPATKRVVRMVIYTSDGKSAVMAILTGEDIELNNVESIMSINL